MHRHGFAEVETPNLTRSTPEGARDFVVPVRLQPGKWYALPQSPQLFKQLLMIGGLERYYQIARCFRDEDFRADRQPEFTQLDFEMSFVDRDDVLADRRGRRPRAVAGAGRPTTCPEIPRMTYREAMDRFGSDKPDLRFGIELTELTVYFADTPFRVFQAPYVGAVVMPGGGSQPRRAFDAWQDWAKSRGARGPGLRDRSPRTARSAARSPRTSPTPSATGLVAAVGAKPGDCVFFAAGAAPLLAGAARRGPQRDRQAAGADRAGHAGRSCSSSTSRCSRRPRSGDWTFMHHPFTSPTPEWRERFAEDKGAALSDAYDMVINGNEVMSGSVRIHDADAAGAGLRDPRHVARGGPGAVRVLPRGLRLRAAAARRRRARLGPALGAAHRRRVDPRGHRLPEDRRRLRPADRCADADHRGAAHGGRHRRQAGGAAAARRARRARTDDDPRRGEPSRGSVALTASAG